MGSEQNTWQRTYDESIAREQTRGRKKRGEHGAEELSDNEFLALEGSMWLPGWAAVLGGLVAGLAIAVRRRGRRRA